MRGEPGRVCSGHAGWLRVEVRLVPRTVRAEKESVLSTPRVVEKPERSEWKGQWRTRHHRLLPLTQVGCVLQAPTRVGPRAWLHQATSTERVGVASRGREASRTC